MLFFSHFLEYLGLPLPGETMMLVSGFMCTGWLSVAITTATGTAGTFLGSMLGYAIGFRYGEGAVLRIGRPFHITKESLAGARAALEKHEALYLIFSRFVPGVRHVVPYITGITKLSRRKFIICNAVSSVIWCTFFVVAGNLLGQKWVIFQNLVNSYSITALLVLCFIYLVYKFGGRYRFIIYGVALPIIAFTAIALLQGGSRTHLFDSAVYAFMLQFARLKVFFATISALDSLAALAGVAVICALVLWRKKAAFWGRMLALNFAASFILGEAVNLIFRRPRPEFAVSFIRVVLYTFPSVNSMLALSFYGFVIYLLHRFSHRLIGGRFLSVPLTIFLVLVIIATGASSVFLNQFNASDVLAGYSAGFSLLVLFVAAVQKLRPKAKTPA